MIMAHEGRQSKSDTLRRRRNVIATINQTGRARRSSRTRERCPTRRTPAQGLVNSAVLVVGNRVNRVSTMPAGGTGPDRREAPRRTRSLHVRPEGIDRLVNFRDQLRRLRTVYIGMAQLLDQKLDRLEATIDSRLLRNVIACGFQ